MAQFFADHHFHIGNTHLGDGTPCQDYALSGRCDGLAYAIVSDGCSTGGHTDMGARLLAFATAQAIEELWTGKRSAGCADHRIELALRQRLVLGGGRAVLGLVQGDLLATCGYALVSDRGGQLALFGDGVLAWKLRDGRCFMSRYDWAGNTPFYPIYAADGCRAFVEVHGGDIEAKVLHEAHWLHDPSAGFVRKYELDWTMERAIRGVSHDISLNEVSESLACLAVFSDGVTQIDGVDWKEAVVELLAFKSTAGAFAKRRMIRTVKRCRRTGRGPLDDLAYAVIRIEPEA